MEKEGRSVDLLAESWSNSAMRLPLKLQSEIILFKQITLSRLYFTSLQYLLVSLSVIIGAVVLLLQENSLIVQAAALLALAIPFHLQSSLPVIELTQLLLLCGLIWEGIRLQSILLAGQLGATLWYRGTERQNKQSEKIELPIKVVNVNFACLD